MEISFWKIFFSRLIEVFIKYQHQIKNFYTNKEQNICVPMFYIDFYCDNLKQSNFKDKM